MKKILIILVSIVAVGALGMFGIRLYTKSFSPEETVVYNQDQLTITYCRPYKNDREIFGGLVPFGEVWRTGANESTTFTCNRDILFGGVPLKSGSYSLWTIPEKDFWTIILNAETGQWGVSASSVANRDPEEDVLSIEVPVITTPKVFEQFTITFEEHKEELDMIMMWDTTLIVIPIKILP